MGLMEKIIALKPEARAKMQKNLAEELARIALIHARAQHYENHCPEDFTHEVNMQMTVDFAFAMTKDANLANNIAHGLAGDKYPLREGFLTSSAALEIAKVRFPKLTVRTSLHKIKEGKAKGYHAEHVSVRAAFIQNKNSGGAPVAEGSALNWNTDVAFYQALIRMLYAEVLRIQLNVCALAAGVSPIGIVDAKEEAAMIKWPLTQLKKKFISAAKAKEMAVAAAEEREERAFKRMQSSARRHKEWQRKSLLEKHIGDKKDKFENEHIGYVGDSNDLDGTRNFIDPNKADDIVYGYSLDGDRANVVVNVPKHRAKEVLDTVSRTVR